MNQREIKFRAWDEDSSEMLYSEKLGGVYDFFLDFNKDGLGLWLSVKDNYAEKRDAVLMQFTGLKDKNGKEIYEGDIVKVNDSYAPTYNTEMRWHGNGWWLKDGRGGNFLPNMENIEIIGNIYENPDLLSTK